MDNSGNFSIQVIMEALAPCGLELLPFLCSDPRATSARENSCNEQAVMDIPYDRFKELKIHHY
jgi:hypothetical protein